MQDSPMTDFSIILQRHTAVTQHSMVIFMKATVSSKQDQFTLTVNPLLSPPGGLFFSSTFEGGLNREGGLI